MGWTVESVVEPPPEQVTDPLPAEETPGEVATLPPGENAAVERETPTWLEMPKKQNKGVLLAARGWVKPADPEPFHYIFDTVLLLRPRLQEEGLGYEDLVLADAVLRMCFSDELSRSRPVAKYAGRLWPLADMKGVFTTIGKDLKALPADLEPMHWVRLIQALVESERRHEEGADQNEDEGSAT
ncbi:hypothetical protein Pmar_PMAR011057 [Perkinsus marinus ATCC 50983]|uniref:Uncharacterized protein n=1 Tax=Perkinsus marinus (strain ATCC 50983 / TXsc) TaxID=423536 RepID=C5L9N7_PERM5|nr:hypothetical protein Pmar_PMAR011057 [Perkinsus marinus ATCC 50983]EER06557.1 hypothetical protein Pmar_PMAR011057 [Perkinsus marinus ATCC 50983]|eukprot:XP_002774741.1 hypothetical protein Pmar_PMAR011057 [Perkinsus marinus ATCC 50983]